jgi:hypothetical protein
VPRLRTLFPTAEIVVVEQEARGKFRKPILLNLGALNTEGDLLIFHDVDFLPDEEAVYYDNDVDVYLPVRSALFVDENMTPKASKEIPKGYQHFDNGVDNTFFGGVLVFTREAFYKVNGSNTLYKGWGFEDEDLRNRVLHYGLKMERNQENIFVVLNHKDSAPPFTDQDFLDNLHRAQRSKDYLMFGLETTHATAIAAPVEVPGVDKWLMVTDLDGPTNIVMSSFNYEEGEE